MHLTPLIAWSSFTSYRHLKLLLQAINNFDDFTSMNVNSNNIVTMGFFTNQTNIILVSETH